MFSTVVSAGADARYSTDDMNASLPVPYARLCWIQSSARSPLAVPASPDANVEISANAFSFIVMKTSISIVIFVVTTRNVQHAYCNVNSYNKNIHSISDKP